MEKIYIFHKLNCGVKKCDTPHTKIAFYMLFCVGRYRIKREN